MAHLFHSFGDATPAYGLLVPAEASTLVTLTRDSSFAGGRHSSLPIGTSPTESMICDGSSLDGLYSCERSQPVVDSDRD
jgi:hypothetical protein